MIDLSRAFLAICPRTLPLEMSDEMGGVALLVIVRLSGQTDLAGFAVAGSEVLLKGLSLDINLINQLNPAYV